LKKIILIFLPLYIFASPKWFYNISHKNYEIIAYGVDKDLQVARDVAKLEISKQININISSNLDINKSIKNNISTSSNTTLQGIKILKEEHKDLIWYL